MILSLQSRSQCRGVVSTQTGYEKYICHNQSYCLYPKLNVMRLDFLKYLEYLSDIVILSLFPDSFTKWYSNHVCKAESTFTISCTLNLQPECLLTKAIISIFIGSAKLDGNCRGINISPTLYLGFITASFFKLSCRSKLCTAGH